MNASSLAAYKRGYQDFYGRNFKVTPDVLIPRPETEQIIDMVLNLTGTPYLPGVKPAPAVLPKNLTILDVGTGSGCIAITLKLQLPKANINACDISTKALKIAKENSAEFHANINFFQSDLLKSAAINPDLIIANLPYVDKTWSWLDLNSLNHEPSLALFAEDHGLALIKQLIDQISAYHSSDDLYLILEADPCQHEEIKKYALDHNLEHIKTTGFILLFRISA